MRPGPPQHTPERHHQAPATSTTHDRPERTDTMSITGKFQTAFLQYRTEQIAAQRLHDPDLTPEANRRRQADARAAARAKLRDAIPQRPDGPDPRQAVMDQIKPTTADQIAVLAHEQAKINALIDNGSNVLQLIDQADERRLTALADWAETSDRVLSSPDPEAAQAELRDRVFDRLADLGHEDAVKAQETAQDRELTLAVADALEGLARGELNGGAMTTIYRTDPDTYRGTFGANLPTADRQTLAEADRAAQRDALHEQQADQQRDRMGRDQ